MRPLTVLRLLGCLACARPRRVGVAQASRPTPDQIGNSSLMLRVCDAWPPSRSAEVYEKRNDDRIQFVAFQPQSSSCSIAFCCSIQGRRCYCDCDPDGDDAELKHRAGGRISSSYAFAWLHIESSLRRCADHEPLEHRSLTSGDHHDDVAERNVLLDLVLAIAASQQPVARSEAS